LESVAFQNPNGSKAMVISNTSSAEKTFTVRWGSQGFVYSLPSGTVATFTWNGEQQIADVPTPPTGLKVKAVNEKNILSWEFSPLADTYTIKRADTPSGPYTVIAKDINVPEYFDSGITAGNSYYYVISAVNAFGESSDSAEISAAPF